ncbi:MAG: proline dehydrogenase family protein [Pseudomonadota bacterium]
MSALSYLARRFVAGETLDDAMKAVISLNRDGILASLDVLGENVHSETEAAVARDEYLRLLDEIRRLGVKSNVSLKLTQMGLDMGHELCISNVRRIVERARQYGNFVRIDMEGSAYTERTLGIFTELRKTCPNLGIVLQAYLHRSEEDAKKLVELKAPVRVCKGAYKEPASIAFHRMEDIRRSFRQLVEILLKAGSNVGIATHDEKLIRWALEWTAREKIPRDRFEFQVLYGLRRKRARQLAAEGYPVRFYVPFGTHWLPYFVRRLRERKENVFFVLKSLVAD